MLLEPRRSERRHTQVLTVFDKVDHQQGRQADPAEYEMALRVLSGQQS